MHARSVANIIVLIALLHVFCLLGATPVESADLKYSLSQQPGHKDCFDFDTGVLRGRLRLDGKGQGIASMVHVPSGVELARGGPALGIFSYYRMFSTDARHGQDLRRMPTKSRLLDDGAVEVRWLPECELPVELSAVFRFSAADTLDVETTVVAKRELPRFEVFLSSYFSGNFRASAYVKPNRHATGQAELLSADVNPLVEGTYLIFPRDADAVRMICDRRWDFPPHPVHWSITRWMAGPLGVQQDPTSGVAALLMSPPSDCFAVSMSYNKTPPDNVAGHHSTYLSLFGRDLKKGEKAKARSRLVVVRKESEEGMIKRYKEFVGLK
ncbi:MAG: hypothetical protein JXM70_10910 [Pirellulales bacterium]|nr:hypothetical protein [Pirellulales bacterium]